MNDEVLNGTIGTTGGMKIEPGACSGTTIEVVGGAAKRYFSQFLGSGHQPSVRRNFHSYWRRFFFQHRSHRNFGQAVSATSSGRVLAISHNRLSRRKRQLVFRPKDVAANAIGNKHGSRLAQPRHSRLADIKTRIVFGPRHHRARRRSAIRPNSLRRRESQSTDTARGRSGPISALV